MLRFRRLLLSGVQVAAQSSGRIWGTSGTSIGVSALAAGNLEVSKASTCINSFWSNTTRGLNTSVSCRDDDLPPTYDAALFVAEPERNFRPLADKELWHEAWMYEDRFGSELQPINVPSLEDERIIGVTDPEDESLIVWGILKAGEPPRQFIEGGEYYVLTVVQQVKKVGDVLLQLAESEAASGVEPTLSP